LETQVKLQFEKFDSFISEVSANVSLGGMFIRTEQPAPVGAMLNFELRLSDDFKLIQGRGEVVWVRPADEGPDKPAGMGIRFRELDTASRELIYKIVYHRMKAGQRPFDLTAAATGGGGGPVKGIGGVPSGPAPTSVSVSPPAARPAAPPVAAQARPSAQASAPAPRPAASPSSTSPTPTRPPSVPPAVAVARPPAASTPAVAPRVATPGARTAAPTANPPAPTRTSAAARQAGLPGANPRPSESVEVVPPASPVFADDDAVGAAPASRPPDGGRSMARQTVAPAIVPTPLPSLAATAPVSPPSEILSAVDDVLTTSPLAGQPLALDPHPAPPLGEAEMSFRGLRMSEGELAPRGGAEQAGFTYEPTEPVAGEPLARLSRRTLSADTIVRRLSVDDGEPATHFPSEPSAAELEETDSLAIGQALGAAPPGLSPVWSSAPPAADELSFADLSELPRARPRPPAPVEPVAPSPSSDPFAELARRTAPSGTQPLATTAGVDLAGAETLRLETPRRPAAASAETPSLAPAGAKPGQERITAAMILTALEAEERREPPAPTPRPAEPAIFGAAAERPQPAASGWAVALVSLAVLAGLGYVFRAQVMGLLGLDQKVTLTAADHLRQDEASGLPILPDVSQGGPSTADAATPVAPEAGTPAAVATDTAPAGEAAEVAATPAPGTGAGTAGAWPSNPEPAPAPPAGAERSRSRPTSLPDEPPPASTKPAPAPAVVVPPLPTPAAPQPAAPGPTSPQPAAPTSPAAATKPAAPAAETRFTSIDSIRARADGARTVVTVTANGGFVAKSWSRFRLDGGQPRELFKFYGLKRDFRDGKIPVGTPQLLQIRAANHPGGELHVVLDLASGANRVTAAEVSGNVLTLTVE
jgi:uncharacterized protein (TIGR02266 family)